MHSSIITYCKNKSKQRINNMYEYSNQEQQLNNGYNSKFDGACNGMW